MGDLIPGVANQCHSASWKLKGLCGWKLQDPHCTTQIPEKRCLEQLSGGSWWWFSPAGCLLWQEMLISWCLPSLSAIQGGSFGLDTSLELSKSHIWQERPSLLPPLLLFKVSQGVWERSFLIICVFIQSDALGYGLQMLLAEHKFMTKNLLKASKS